MDGPNLFWTVFAAVLGAHLLAGAFFWGALAYTRLEKEGRENTKAGRLPLGMMLMALAFMGLSFFITMSA
ncbi:hypothetical protein [Aurantimonas coralicida]|uniref:hypothetical protein n=1 Tax=Aurantimonas coralicida TaxID=182270 RepID=UPI001E577A2A|nr:hypothetical protein [Aurantimonas coralicida]MCD1644169.1 hypothetical protein [Aurantimonas coralicida]